MPPLWRPGLSEEDKAKVVESRRLLPIAPRAGIYLTTPYSAPDPAAARTHGPYFRDRRFASIFRDTWFRIPRRARMRLRRYWRDESWLWHSCAYSPRITLLQHWPNRPRHHRGVSAGHGRYGHQMVAWSGAIDSMPQKHVATVIAGFLAEALHFVQESIDGRTHGVPRRVSDDEPDPCWVMTEKRIEDWGFSIDGMFKWYYRNARPLRHIDQEIRHYQYLLPRDSEIVVCDRSDAPYHMGLMDIC